MPINVLMSEFSDYRYDARVLKQAKSLAENGYDVKLVMYNSSILKNKISRKENFTSIEIAFKNRYRTKTVLDRIVRLFSFVKVFLNYFYYIITLEADIYHAHNFFVGWMLFLSCKLRGSIYLYDCHEIIWEEKEFYYKLGGFIERILINSAKFSMCPSNDRGVLIKEHYNLSKDPVILCNYPSLKSYKCIRTERKTNIYTNLSIKSDSIILLYTGMISVYSRLQDKVICALPMLPDNLYFIIVGFGHKREIQYLMKTANENNVQHRVIILPPRNHDELLEFATHCDIGISLLKNIGLPYRYHALNKFYEYVASGLAVLASDFPTFNQEINYNPIGKIGEVCSEENPNRIAFNINKMIKNDSYKEYKVNSKQLFIKNWNWENQSKYLMSNYENLFKK